MRISDWSSDVCSSDLDTGREAVVEAVGVRPYPPGCGLLKGEGEGIEDLRRAKPAKLVGARQDVDADMLGVAVSDAAVVRKSVVYGTRVSVHVDRGGSRILQPNKSTYQPYSSKK